MLRVRHIKNNARCLQLQFRKYFAYSTKIEPPENAEANEKFENVGKWISTFTHSISKDEVRKGVAIISSKKKIVREFKEFILTDFTTTTIIEEYNQLLENANLVIDDVVLDIHELRKAVNEKNTVRINTLIEDAILALNTLQTKLIETK